MMSKTNDTSNLVTFADSELDAVTGGMGLAPMWFQVQAMQQIATDQEAVINKILGTITPPTSW
jgi:hypothetical protein